MATQTTNLHLIKPDLNDPADIGDINDNMDTLDAFISALGTKSKFVVFENGAIISTSGTYTITVQGIDDYWRPSEIVLSDPTAVLADWSGTVSSSGVVSLTIPSGAIGSNGTRVYMLLEQTTSNA